MTLSTRRKLLYPLLVIVAVIALTSPGVLTLVLKPVVIALVFVVGFVSGGLWTYWQFPEEAQE